MKKIVNILCCIGALLFLLAAALCYHEAKVSAGAKYETVYDTVPWFDTIPYYLPVPKDSVVIRYVTATLPAAHDTETADDVPEDTVCTAMVNDSVRVEIPITQKVYSTPDYTAYVSGYRASLDSFYIYREHYVLEPRPPDKPKPPKVVVSIGPYAGFGNKGANYGVAISVGIPIWSW